MKIWKFQWQWRACMSWPWHSTPIAFVLIITKEIKCKQSNIWSKSNKAKRWGVYFISCRSVLLLLLLLLWGLIGVLSNYKGPIKDMKRTRGRLDRNVAPLPMSSAHSMNARKCAHAKSPTPLRQSRMNQAGSEEEEKERNRDRKDRGQEADGKKGSPL